jgi:hypothetical protein
MIEKLSTTRNRTVVIWVVVVCAVAIVAGVLYTHWYNSPEQQLKRCTDNVLATTVWPTDTSPISNRMTAMTLCELARDHGNPQGSATAPMQPPAALPAPGTTNPVIPPTGTNTATAQPDWDGPWVRTIGKINKTAVAEASTIGLSNPAALLDSVRAEIFLACGFGDPEMQASPIPACTSVRVRCG